MNNHPSDNIADAGNNAHIAAVYRTNPL